MSWPQNTATKSATSFSAWPSSLSHFSFIKAGNNFSQPHFPHESGPRHPLRESGPALGSRRPEPFSATAESVHVAGEPPTSRNTPDNRATRGRAHRSGHAIRPRRGLTHTARHPLPHGGEVIRRTGTKTESGRLYTRSAKAAALSYREMRSAFRRLRRTDLLVNRFDFLTHQL